MTGKRLFHVTQHPDSILREGFRDGSGSYGLAGTATEAVFLSDIPVDEQELGFVDRATLTVLSVDFPDDFDLDEFAWIEEGALAGWRKEWAVPAALINEHATVAVAPSSDQLE